MLEAWLAAASSIWNALELMFQWHKLGKADHWRLLYSEKLRSGGHVRCLLLTFALTKKQCSIGTAQKTIIMLLWCAGCCCTGFPSLYSSWLGEGVLFFSFSGGCKRGGQISHESTGTSATGCVLAGCYIYCTNPSESSEEICHAFWCQRSCGNRKVGI